MKEERRQKTGDRMGAGGLVLFCLLVPVFVLLADGCSTTKESSTYDRQEQALKDPFGYNGDPKKSDLSVTGDGDKDALKRDVDHVLNP
jgi:hypothetical protein